VIRPDKEANAMFQIPELRTSPGGISQDLPGKIRSLQVLGPLGIEFIDLIVHHLQPVNLVWRQLVFDYDDEIDVAVLIVVPYGKGALQVSTNEALVQGLLKP
jgi:hypothetical protein